MGGWLWNKAKGFFSDLKGKMLGMFDINSPSGWARDMLAKNIVRGIAVGLDKNAIIAINSIENLMGGLKTASMASLGATSNTTNNNSIVQNFYNKQTSPFDSYKKAVRAFAY